MAVSPLSSRPNPHTYGTHLLTWIREPQRKVRPRCASHAVPSERHAGADCGCPCPCDCERRPFTCRLVRGRSRSERGDRMDERWEGGGG